MVAVEETVAQFRHHLGNDVQKTLEHQRRLSRLLGRELLAPEDSIDLEAETLSFREGLLSQLRNAETEILGYPNTTHEELVQRATARRRPFNAKGSGYRDSLIWQSVLALASSVGEDIVLASADKDFADDGGMLHHDLKEDVISLGLPAQKITLSDDLRALVDKHVRPRLGAAPWDPELEILTRRGVNLQDAIAVIIQNAFLGEELESRDLGFPPEYMSPTLDIVESVSGLTIRSTRTLAPDRLLVEMRATVGAVVEFFLYKPDWYRIEDDGIIIGHDSWDDDFILAGKELSLGCRLDLVVDNSDSEHPEVQDVSVRFDPVEA